ncbi:hypothetical protein QE152_g39664 [Popillia japonica]|uniref:CCHC-type domain-containing protein n=1 Tax=Popillia japonica TaxID=7064 RepID=A0AAW1HTI3_POPJA
MSITTTSSITSTTTYTTSAITNPISSPIQQQTGTQNYNIQNCTISTMSTLRNPILPKFVGPPKFDPSQHDAVNFLKAYTSAAEYNAWDDNLRPICFRCHRPGHTAAACRTGISQQNNSGNNRGRE